MLPWSKTLDVEPTAKGAVKVSMQSGYVRKFTPQKTRDAMNDVRYALKAAGAPLFEGAVTLTLEFSLVRPKSVSVKKRPHATARGDLSNYVKMFEDAANGILWHDDSQVVKIDAVKFYGERKTIFVCVSRYEA